ncbi:MAG: hypothetical protein GXY83_17880 [Rhodopirellula sp.]|nr:hypothetical protein [Rhodopirellula sp.]
MSLVGWVALYAIESLFFYWVYFRDGADQLEGTLASGFLLGNFAPRWSAEGIRLFVAVTFSMASVWFVVGLFAPAVRSW